jgi:hypothetical protein
MTGSFSARLQQLSEYQGHTYVCSTCLLTTQLGKTVSRILVAPPTDNQFAPVPAFPVLTAIQNP